MKTYEFRVTVDVDSEGDSPSGELVQRELDKALIGHFIPFGDDDEHEVFTFTVDPQDPGERSSASPETSVTYNSEVAESEHGGRMA
jgi:hypothetical protein